MKKNCKLFAVVLFAALSVISCKNNFIELENEIENINEKAYLTFGINESSERKITPSKLTWNEVNSIDLSKDSSVVKTWTTTAEKSAYEQMKADTSVALDAGKYTFAVTLKDKDGDILQKGELKDVEIKVGENPLNFTAKPYLEGKGKLTVNCYGSDSTKIKMVNCHIYNIEKLAGDSHDNSFDEDKYQTSYSFSFDEIDCGIYSLYVEMKMDGAYTRRITECVEIQNKRETVFNFSYDEELKIYPVEYRFDDKDGTRVQFSDDSYNKTYTNTKTLPDASTITNAPEGAKFLGWYYEGNKITEIPEVTNTIVVIKPAYEITIKNVKDLVPGVNLYNITPTDENFDTICQKIKDGKIAFGVLDLSKITTDSIADEAFKDLTVSTVILPENVTTIGAFAFNGCSSLSQINIPESVESIGASAFYSCKKLENITIPEKVTTIGDKAFSWCNSLQEIEIPASVTSIGAEAFKACRNLTKVTFIERTKNISIGESAFASCSKLTTITIPETVTSIGTKFFSGCSKLEKIEIQASVTSIGDNAFENCTSLSTVVFLENSKLTSIGKYAFAGCSDLEEITIPDGVTEIKEGTFANTGLSTIDLSSHPKLESIGVSAFRDCKYLESVYLPDTITSIGETAFSNCQKLNDCEYPGTAKLGKDAFKGTQIQLN